MISLTHARKEIARLSTRTGYPKHSAELGWLVDSLRLGSRSNEHATQVISEALDASQNCPTPDDLRALCADVGRQQNQYPPSCEKCRQPGLHDGTWTDGNWIVVTVVGRGVKIQSATRCDCARGRLLAAKDEEEKRKAAYSA